MTNDLLKPNGITYLPDGINALPSQSKMTNDLIARASDYLEQVKGITPDGWNVDSIYTSDDRFIDIPHVDSVAINQIPTARALILELVKEVENLKNHGIDLLDQYCSMAKHLENLGLISNLQDAREYAKGKLEVFQTKDNNNDQ
jgi:hypothetical protein